MADDMDKLLDQMAKSRKARDVGKQLGQQIADGIEEALDDAEMRISKALPTDITQSRNVNAPSRKQSIADITALTRAQEAYNQKLERQIALERQVVAEMREQVAIGGTLTKKHKEMIASSEQIRDNQGEITQAVKEAKKHYDDVRHDMTAAAVDRARGKFATTPTGEPKVVNPHERRQGVFYPTQEHEHLKTTFDKLEKVDRAVGATGGIHVDAHQKVALDTIAVS